MSSIHVPAPYTERRPPLVQTLRFISKHCTTCIHSETSKGANLALFLRNSYAVASDRFVDPQHRALDHAFSDVEFLAEKRAFEPAALRFTEFRTQLEEHLREEETVLFPDFESRTGDAQQVLPLIRGQHAQLEYVA